MSQILLKASQSALHAPRVRDVLLYAKGLHVLSTTLLLESGPEPRMRGAAGTDEPDTTESERPLAWKKGPVPDQVFLLGETTVKRWGIAEPMKTLRRRKQASRADPCIAASLCFASSTAPSAFARSIAS